MIISGLAYCTKNVRRFQYMNVQFAAHQNQREGNCTVGYPLPQYETLVKDAVTLTHMYVQYAYQVVRHHYIPHLEGLHYYQGT